jgi:hypothetical protein
VNVIVTYNGVTIYHITEWRMCCTPHPTFQNYSFRFIGSIATDGDVHDLVRALSEPRKPLTVAMGSHYVFRSPPRVFLPDGEEAQFACDANNGPQTSVRIAESGAVILDVVTAIGYPGGKP